MSPGYIVPIASDPFVTENAWMGREPLMAQRVSLLVLSKRNISFNDIVSQANKWRRQMAFLKNTI